MNKNGRTEVMANGWYHNQNHDNEVKNLVLWVIFQYDNVIKVGGMELDSGLFRISSEIVTLSVEKTCTSIITKRGTHYVLHGMPCNISLHYKIVSEIGKHVLQRSANGWYDVSYYGQTSVFDGDYV